MGTHPHPTTRRDWGTRWQALPAPDPQPKRTRKTCSGFKGLWLCATRGGHRHHDRKEPQGLRAERSGPTGESHHLRAPVPAFPQPCHVSGPSPTRKQELRGPLVGEGAELHVQRTQPRIRQGRSPTPHRVAVPSWGRQAGLLAKVRACAALLQDGLQGAPHQHPQSHSGLQGQALIFPKLSHAQAKRGCSHWVPQTPSFDAWPGHKAGQKRETPPDCPVKREPRLPSFTSRPSAALPPQAPLPSSRPNPRHPSGTQSGWVLLQASAALRVQISDPQEPELRGCIVVPHRSPHTTGEGRDAPARGRQTLPHHLVAMPPPQ